AGKPARKPPLKERILITRRKEIKRMRTDSLIGVDDAGKPHMRNIDFTFGVEMEFVNLSEGRIF
uniref:hypothetical protein n=1 Tax=Oscillibacter ruminantium TaxID=1263547 RepID=UPI0033341DD2